MKKADQDQRKFATHLFCYGCLITKPVGEYYPGELSKCMECKKKASKESRERKRLRDLNQL
jgi:hypothetical protein